MIAARLSSLRVGGRSSVFIAPILTYFSKKVNSGVYKLDVKKYTAQCSAKPTSARIGKQEFEMAKWNLDSMPDQTGRFAIVTGANTGIGFETAAALAAGNANVVLACRSEPKALDAMERIRARTPAADLEFIELDLASLSSVEVFATAYRSGHQRLDLLINNAGVMVPPLGHTEDGFELQFGCNHLGHFALAGRLMDLLQATPGARVVNVSSMAHRQGKMDFDNLNAEKGYEKWPAYGQSKLANLLFTFELQRRLEQTGSDVIATAAHPGWTGTDLQRHSSLIGVLNHVFAQSPPMGALPTLRAATDLEAEGGNYYGPKGLYEMRGYPVMVGTTDAAKNELDARRLWQVSEELTGVSFLGRDTAAA
jgi:NAD(P)-dependent dehydrogenase (short-subunit alcohol dehydrogenase family)